MTSPLRSGSSRSLTPASVLAAATSAAQQTSATLADRGGDAFIRRRGRELLFAFYGALRTVKLYPADNAVVQQSLDELLNTSAGVLAHEHELELRATGEFLFINGTRLRLDLEHDSSISRSFSSLFRGCGIGLFRVREGAAKADWLHLLNVLNAVPPGEPDQRRQMVIDKLAANGVISFELGPPTDTEEEFREKSKEAAKRTYAQSVTLTKDVINSVRMGKSPNIKKIKRVVQGIVDQILNEETSLIGLTTLHDYDEYTFTHSVNVCIFAIALGRKLGFNRLQVYELGIAALLHDIGKTRIPLEVLNKPGGLTESEWRTMTNHPWLGVLSLFQMHPQDIPFRALVVAFEHHKKIDLSGYPKHIRPREMSIFSKIVAVVDSYDAATSRRVYQTTPLSPADVLHEMRTNRSRGMDQVVLKGFMSLIGHFPVGTCVVLDTMELAVVHAVNPIAEAVSRPIVRIVGDERGHLLHPGHLVDLNERAPGATAHARTIIKIVDPDRHGIRVSDYFV